MVSMMRKPGAAAAADLAHNSLHISRKSGDESSSLQFSIPNAAARPSMLPPVVTEVGVVCAIPLFSTTNSIGNSQMEARFRLSYTNPWPSVPSPITTATIPVPPFRMAKACPAPMAVIPP